MKLLLLILFYITSTLSIVLFKYGFLRLGFRPSIDFLIKWLTYPPIFLSLVLAFACRFIFYGLLREYPASVAQFLTALNMVIVALACVLIFGEVMNYKQILGAILIFVGIILMGC